MLCRGSGWTAESVRSTWCKLERIMEGGWRHLAAGLQLHPNPDGKASRQRGGVRDVGQNQTTLLRMLVPDVPGMHACRACAVKPVPIPPTQGSRMRPSLREPGCRSQVQAGGVVEERHSDSDIALQPCAV